MGSCVKKHRFGAGMCHCGMPGKDRGDIHVVQQVQDVILLLLVISFET